MRLARAEYFCLALVLSSFIAATLGYGLFPDPTPVPLNLITRGFVPKPWGPYILPAISAAAFVLMLWVPRFSTARHGIAPALPVHRTIQIGLQLYLFSLTLIPILAGLGAPISIDHATTAAVGLLLVFVGNLSGKTRKNLFIGIVTPWTRASDEVWLHTNRLAGWLMVLSGLVLFAASILGKGIALGLAAVIAAALISIVYSYVVYRRLQSDQGHTP
jgi:immunity protein, SdpI family